jgi:hypothetical protein
MGAGAPKGESPQCIEHTFVAQARFRIADGLQSRRVAVYCERRSVSGSSASIKPTPGATPWGLDPEGAACGTAGWPPPALSAHAARFARRKGDRGIRRVRTRRSPGPWSGCPRASLRSGRSSAARSSTAGAYPTGTPVELTPARLSRFGEGQGQGRDGGGAGWSVPPRRVAVVGPQVLGVLEMLGPGLLVSASQEHQCPES